MSSIDLPDTYFHIPVHPVSKQLLRFMHQGKTLQFRALPFGLSTSAKNVHQNYETGGGFRSSTRRKTAPIPGRLATDSRKPSNSQTTDIMTPNILRENSSERTCQDKTITMATEVPLETKSGPNVQKNTSITRMPHLLTMMGRQA